MRIDDAEQINLFGITTRLNVWTSIFVLLGALAAFIILGLRKRTEPDTVYLPGREPSDTETDTDTDRETDADTDPDPGTDAGDDTEDKAPATVPAYSGTVRHSDSAVSDSESRDNLPENQSGPGNVSAPAETSKESTGGTNPATGTPAAGTPGHQATGTAPDAEGTK